MESDKGSENPPVAGSGDGADVDRATKTPAERKRVTIGAGLIAAMVLSAAAFIYFERSATETTSTPTSVQQTASTPAQQIAPASAPKPEQKAADAARPAPTAEKPAVQSTAAEQANAPPPPAATSTPPAQPAPTASSTPSRPAPSTPEANAGMARPPGSEAPPGSADSAPVQSAQAPPAASLRDQPTSLPARETVVVQKPRVNIRSEPTRRSRVVGSARKGEQFKVVRRTGSWVQVEGASGRGWIGGRVLESVAR